MTVKFGQCVNHGYVDERCCSLFEPRQAKPFLAAAMAEAGGEEGLRRSLRSAVREALTKPAQPGRARTLDAPDFPPPPSTPMPHAHRWLPAGLIHSGTMVVQSCECGVVRTVKVPG